MDRTLISKLSVHAVVVVLAGQIGATALAAQNQRARDRVTQNSATRPSHTMSDSDFVGEAYGRNLGELKLAHLAVNASRDPEIQKIGHRIINEQQRANDDLKKVAESKSITLPSLPNQKDEQEYDRLSKLQGGDFDKAYRDHLNTEFKRTVQIYENASKNAQDAQVRDVASQYASLFEQHAQAIGITGVGSERGYVRERETTTSTATPAASAPLTKADQTFLTRTHLNNMVEVQAARLALKNSKDKQVQTVAQTVLTEHQQMQQELNDLASKKGVTLTKQLPQDQQDFLDKLGKLSGQEFDEAYSKDLLGWHRNAEKQFTQASSSADPDVKSFASRHEGAIRDHLRMIQRTGSGNNR